MSATFDKLAYVETLKAGGAPDEAARVHAQALETALKESVASQQDITNLRHELALLSRDLKIGPPGSRAW